MALSDLLWACPTCGADRGLAGAEAVCSSCGTRFQRGPRGTIRATAPDGGETVRSAAEWLERLPAPSTLLGSDPIRVASVLVRRATGSADVFGEAGYLNRVEVFGDEEHGWLRLEADRLVLEGLQGEGEWPLETLTAVQASSNNLQIKRKGEPLVSFRFQDDAIYLWEHLLRAALRDFYGRTGRGVIREFQPRIDVGLTRDTERGS